MSVQNGQPVNASVTNAAFVSRLVDSDTIAKVGLKNTDTPNSGAIINNAQKAINKAFEGIGTTGETDSTINDYSSNNYIVDGDNRKVAIEKLDTQLGATQAQLAALDAINSQDVAVVAIGSAPNANALTLIGQVLNIEPASAAFGGVVTTGVQSFAGNKTFVNDVAISGAATVGGNLTVTGDITVNGTTTTVNSTNVSTVDKNIFINSGGNDASSEGAGLTVDRTGTDGSFIYKAASATKWAAGDLASEVDLVGTTSTQTLTNKTLTSPVINTPTGITKTDVGLSNVTNDSQLKRSANDFNSFTEKTTLAADDVFIIEDSAASGAKKFVKKSNLGASGSGGGAVNLITNGDAENAVSSIFTPYLNTAQRLPVTGSGGSPTVTTSVTSTNPLTLTKSFLLTKPASNTQGQGWSVSSFTVDPSYRAKVLKIDIDYIINSGAFVAGSSTTDSDVIFYLYDITNSLLIEPSNIKLFSNSTTISDKYQATFQTSVTGASYRLIAHCATSSSLAYELKVDTVSVSPSVYIFGSPVTDWLAYTPTFTGLGTVTLAEAFWRRVGDSIQIRGRATLGTTTGINAKISFPAGFTVDPIKNTIQTVIGGELLNNSTATAFEVLISPSDTGILFSAHTLSAALGTAIGSSGAAIGWDSGLVPIAGLSSSAQTSDSGADTRIVDFVGVGTGSTQSLTANVTNISLTVAKDSHTAWTGSTYLVPTAGDYVISGFLYSATQFSATPYINGTSVGKYLLASAANLGGGGALILHNLKSGDLISIRVSATLTLPADTAQNISIMKVSGPQAITATEELSAKYLNGAGTTFTSGTDQIIPFPTKGDDTHGAFVTDTFTCPIGGKYQISATINFASTSVYASGDNMVLKLYKNGAFNSIGDFRIMPTATTTAGCSIFTTSRCIAGDTLSIYVQINRAGGSTSLNTASSVVNHIEIVRVK